MGMLLVFAAGYVMGSRAGSESLDEVIDAVHAIRESEEFHDLLKALRTHAAHSLRGLGDDAGERSPADRSGRLVCGPARTGAGHRRTALTVMSWLTPRRPTTSPDEPMAGSARIANQRAAASSESRYSSSNG